MIKTGQGMAADLRELEPDGQLARRLFAELDAKTRKGEGIVRDTYGPGEQAAHDIVRAVGEALDLEIHTDAALNLYMTLPGRDRNLPPVIVGSHLDSVDQGGNFDGAAGVAAGLASLAGFQRAGWRPPCDVTVMAIRGEESVWFDVSYIGSYAAFGQLDPKELEVPRADNGRSLAEHMAAAGCNLEAIKRGEAYLQPSQVRAFLEVHIEQAPHLVEQSVPLGIVTGIRGDFRYREARCFGVYGHSGALARAYRRDAVAATTALIQCLNDDWLTLEDAGHDLVFTVGELTTDPRFHGPSKVAGETRFVMDFRSIEEQTMFAMRDNAKKWAAEIEEHMGVDFDFGRPTYCEPAELNPAMRKRLGAVARELDLPALEMASGAGHDAAVFANFGVPSGMIFIRNDQGSHNPREAMSLDDFQKAARLLSGYLITALE